MVTIACPSPGPQCDKFGICLETTYVPAVACFSKREKPMEREFDSFEAAQAFVAEMESLKCADDEARLYLEEACLKDIKMELKEQSYLRVVE
jgi:hypothetical protein